jgi:hypothetical protein
MSFHMNSYDDEWEGVRELTEEEMAEISERDILEDRLREMRLWELSQQEQEHWDNAGEVYFQYEIDDFIILARTVPLRDINSEEFEGIDGASLWGVLSLYKDIINEVRIAVTEPMLIEISFVGMNYESLFYQIEHLQYQLFLSYCNQHKVRNLKSKVDWKHMGF